MDLGTGERRAWFPNTQHTKALINFIQWSQGGIVLDAALESIVSAFGAECGVISRSWMNKNSDRVAARADTRGQSNRPLFLSYTNDILGPFRNKPKRASVFSYLDDGKDPSELSAVVSDWVEQRNLHDILFVCLDTQGNEMDFLELHFCRNGDRDYREGIEAIAAELSEIYKNRRPGLITEALSRQSLVKLQKKPVEDALIMSTENPAGLTRAEWRVCVLISRGLSPQAIGAELGIGPATVRTHLKHIYSKTAHDSFHMLARRLVSLEEREALHGIQYQARA